MKTSERDMARKLRRDGLSIREIERCLGVARSSVSLWVRDIELTPEQHESLQQRNPIYNSQLRGQSRWAEICRERRRAWQAEGRATARSGDAFHTAGCMLFWAEGSRNRNMAQLANSDPALIRFWGSFLRTYFDVSDEGIRVACYLFADHVEDVRQIEDFWLETLEVTRASLTKTQVNTYSRHSQRKRLNMLPYGTCRVTVCRTEVVQHLYGAIQEYAGFDRPEWLD